MKSQRNKQGITVPTFSEVTSVWFGPWTLTQSQEMALSGTTLAGTKVIFVYHNPALARLNRAQISGLEYEVVDLNIEEDPGPSSFDLITLRRVTARE
ncbi:phage head closure protein [Furfurilactobacillus siliginis]|uniref:phage head closure protein n=1 Tax=Furfurilactobacillus siliginis TaxID=348151 RepID=UPI00138EE8EC|nr:phage head closure protein [Furfurilactobacillus siliginis]